jgi:hypothetical protein
MNASHGKVIRDIQDLDKKLDLLRAKREIDANDPRNSIFPFDTNKRIAGALKHATSNQSLSGVDISHALERRELSSAYLPSLLRLFGLDHRNQVPQWIEPGNADHERWIDLLKEPVEAFSARVRLLGGESYAKAPGHAWDAYFKPMADDCDKAAKDRLTVYDIHKPLPNASWQRALLPGVPNPIPERPAMPELFVDANVRFQATLGRALSAPVSPLYVLAFHDISLTGSRYFIRLFPLPTVIDADPPKNLAACRAATAVKATELRVPDDESYLVLPSNWGEVRSLVLVISSKQFDDEIMAETAGGSQIPAEALDLLAARLRGLERKYGEDHVLWRLRYRVVDCGTTNL